MLFLFFPLQFKYRWVLFECSLRSPVLHERCILKKFQVKISIILCYLHKIIQVSARLFPFPASRLRSALIPFRIHFCSFSFVSPHPEPRDLKLLNNFPVQEVTIAPISHTENKYRKRKYPDKASRQWFQEKNRNYTESVTFYLKDDFSVDSRISKLMKHRFKALQIIPVSELSLSVSIFHLAKGAQIQNPTVHTVGLQVLLGIVRD